MPAPFDLKGWAVERTPPAVVSTLVRNKLLLIELPDSTVRYLIDSHKFARTVEALHKTDIAVLCNHFPK
jgi:hypothetical protein